MAFAVENVKKALVLFNDRIQKNRLYLSELDTPIGDGDHGSNMARGMDAVSKEKLPEDVSGIFQAVAMKLISTVGGAAGPLYGTAFMSMAQTVKTTNNVADILAAAVKGIENIGGAKPGDKTMLDLWVPAVAALRQGKLTKAKITELVEATKPLEAHKGRASYVGKQSIGHIDPGAMSSGYLFESFLEAGVFND